MVRKAALALTTTEDRLTFGQPGVVVGVEWGGVGVPRALLSVSTR